MCIRDSSLIVQKEEKEKTPNKEEIRMSLISTVPVSYTHLDVYKRQDFSVLPACFTIPLSPMLCRVVISYNMLNVSLILLIFLRSIF